MPDSPQKHDIPEELLDQLLAQVDDPKELFGSGGLLRSLMGRLVEKSLEVELTQHLGYDKGDERAGDNARNGSTPKTLLTEAGKVAVRVPRDRDGSFEPELVRKHQRRVEGFDERILALYSRGMSVREIQDFFAEAYNADVSKTLISEVTQGAMQDVEAWRNRRLDAVYPIVYLDGLVVKVRTDGVVDNRTVYIALGVNLEGRKEVLGLYMAGTEGAKFWLQVITELQNRGLEDILIACCDGLRVAHQRSRAARSRARSRRRLLARRCRCLAERLPTRPTLTHAWRPHRGAVCRAQSGHGPMAWTPAR
jgi:putative transposase